MKFGTNSLQCLKMTESVMIRTNAKERLNNLTEGCDISYYAMTDNDSIQACLETNYTFVALT